MSHSVNGSNVSYADYEYRSKRSSSVSSLSDISSSVSDSSSNNQGIYKKRGKFQNKNGNSLLLSNAAINKSTNSNKKNLRKKKQRRHLMDNVAPLRNNIRAQGARSAVRQLPITQAMEDFIEQGGAELLQRAVDGRLPPRKKQSITQQEIAAFIHNTPELKKSFEDYCAHGNIDSSASIDDSSADASLRQNDARFLDYLQENYGALVEMARADRQDGGIDDHTPVTEEEVNAYANNNREKLYQGYLNSIAKNQPDNINDSLQAATKAVYHYEKHGGQLPAESLNLLKTYIKSTPTEAEYRDSLSEMAKKEDGYSDQEIIAQENRVNNAALWTEMKSLKKVRPDAERRLNYEKQRLSAMNFSIDRAEERALLADDKKDPDKAKSDLAKLRDERAKAKAERFINWCKNFQMLMDQVSSLFRKIMHASHEHAKHV